MNLDRSPGSISLGRKVPIDMMGVDGYKEIPIFDKGDPLVPLGPFSENWRIHTDAIYAGERANSPYRDHPVDGSLMTMFVRKGVARRLLVAQNLLPDNIFLAVNDAYRTVDAQDALYRDYVEALALKMPDLTPIELKKWTVNYVSEPSKDPLQPSTHNTGGSVDVVLLHLPPIIGTEVTRIERELTRSERAGYQNFFLQRERAMLISEYATQLPFNTNFDNGTTQASLDYLEKEALRRKLSSQERIALKCTRLLFNAMSAAGFSPLKSEWWHYNAPETQMAAKISGLKTAGYGPIELSSENLEQEARRRSQIARVLGWEKTLVPKAEIILP